MALARLHTWASGEVLTASDLNGEFNNILNNPTSLITPLTANLALGAFSLTGLGAGSASSPSLSFDSDTDTGIFRSAADSIDLAARGGRVLQASGFADGVNFVRISNAAAGQGAPTIEAAGTDTNVGLRLVAKGSGYVEATSFRFGVFTATQTADHEGRAYWHKDEGTLHIVSGTVMGRVPAVTNVQTGDLIYASGTVAGATTFSRLGIGSSTQVLTVSSGVPAWAASTGVQDRVTTDITIINDSSERTVYTFSVPGGTLQTDRTLRLTILGFGQLVSGTLTARLKYGSTTVASRVHNVALNASSYFVGQYRLVGKGATNAQRGVQQTQWGITAVTIEMATTGGSSTEDSTGALSLALTFQFSVAATNNNFVCEHAVLELL